MKNKSSIVLGVIVAVLVLLGASYAFFVYNNISDNQVEVVGKNIYMQYSDNNTLSLTGYPQSKEEGIENDYFEFSVKAKNESENDLYYAINLMYGNDVVDKNRLDDEDIVFYLTEVIDGKEEVLIDSVQYKIIDNSKIWVENISANTNNNVIHTYRLRMWVSENIMISNTLDDADYTPGEYANSYASVKVNVVGNLQENDINMILDASDDNYVNGKRAIYVDSYGNANDNLVLEVTSDSDNIGFMYEDEKGNSSTDIVDTLTLNYKSYEKEVIVTKVIPVAKNDANTKTKLYFKLTRNGEVVEEQVKGLTIYGNNYCLNNGFNKLGDCILVSEKMSNSVSAAKSVIESKGTPDFTKTAPVMTYVQKIEEDVNNAFSSTGYQFYVSKELNFNSSTGQYNLVDPISIVTLDESGTYEGYYTLGETNKGTSNQTTAYKIGSVKVDGNKTTLTLADKYTYALAEDFDASETGLYKTTDNDGDSYYYRGSVTNNNVKFAGVDWKVIRINGDGSVRMITTSNVSRGLYNSKNEDTAYAGYTYNINFSENETTSTAKNYYNINTGTTYYYGASYSYDSEKRVYTLVATDEKPLITGTIPNIATTENINNGYVYTCFSTSSTGNCEILKKINKTYVTNATYINVKYISHSSVDYEGTIGDDFDSTIKTAVDAWYTSNLANYADYLEDTYFCNDRSLKDATYNSGYKLTEHTYYGAYTRNITNKAPSVICENKNDRYTVENAGGNTWLDYPIGLISADEVMLAGGLYDALNEKYYLENESTFWTGSPGRFHASYATLRIWKVDAFGLAFPSDPMATYGVRPVINIKANVEISSGDGSLENPYQLKLA